MLQLSKAWAFADECELPKKDKTKGKEKTHMAQEDEGEESSLLIVLADEHVDVLLQGINNSLTKHFMRSLNHTNVGQTKFIIPNSQWQRYKIK